MLVFICGSVRKGRISIAQESIIAEARDAGYYIAGVYREKASGARADRPELVAVGAS